MGVCLTPWGFIIHSSISEVNDSNSRYVKTFGLINSVTGFVFAECCTVKCSVGRKINYSSTVIKGKPGSKFVQ
jgi:hypothetical protein